MYQMVPSMHETEQKLILNFFQGIFFSLSEGRDRWLKSPASKPGLIVDERWPMHSCSDNTRTSQQY